MTPRTTSLLSLAPYRILPAQSGGQLGIILPHHYLGKLCPNQVVSTVDNGPSSAYAFNLHPLLPAHPRRYLPFLYYPEIESLVKRYDISHIYCDHPYLAPTAILLSRRHRIPWFLRSHNIEHQRFRDFGKPWWRLFYLFEKAMMRRASGIFFITGQEAQIAREKMGLEKVPYCIAPFGTSLDKTPVPDPRQKVRMAEELGLDPDLPWLYFLGAMDYGPNEGALAHILDSILPRVQQRGTAVQILVAGKGLSNAWQARIQETPSVHYLGFVPDLGALIQSADLMLNPLTEGGGIKTKAVEALAHNKTVISTRSGAAGLDLVPLSPKLQVCEDGDWDAFTENLIRALGQPWQTPPAFYQRYHWDRIAQDMLQFMESI